LRNRDLNRPRILIILGLFGLIVACVSTKGLYLDPTADRYPPVPPESVRIFVTEADLDTLNYVKIGIIEATGSGEYTSQTGMINAIRKKAASMGGNAILLPQIEEPGAGAKVAGAILGTGTERKGNAIVLRVFGRKQVETQE
jgi:hypothetical protein